MPTLGTQNISTSYPQLLKTDDLGGISGTLQAITDGDNTATALELSTAGVRSTGTLNAAGATTLASSLAVTGAVTLSSSLGVTGAATLSSSLGVTGAVTLSSSLGVTGAATLSSSLGVTGAVTLSSSLGVTGVATFSTSINASAGTATIGTATISTATISTATIPTILGSVTFGSNITASTGTATIGTEIVSTSTIGTLAVTATATVGSLEIGGTAGPTITKVSYGTAAFTGSTFQDLDSATAGSNVTTGTFAVTGAALGDIVFGGLTSIGSSTGTNATLAQRLIPSFRVESADTIRYVILNTDIVSHGTTPAGTLFATAMRFTT